MLQQSIDHATATTDPICALVCDTRKRTALDALVSFSQVGTALSLCWVVHHFV